MVAPYLALRGQNANLWVDPHLLGDVWTPRSMVKQFNESPKPRQFCDVVLKDLKG